MIGRQRGIAFYDLPKRILTNLQERGVAGTADALSRLVGAEIWHRFGAGIDIMRADWDNLIILDALRADVCREYAPDDWTVETVQSPATHS